MFDSFTLHTHTHKAFGLRLWVCTRHSILQIEHKDTVKSDILWLGYAHVTCAPVTPVPPLWLSRTCLTPNHLTLTSQSLASFLPHTQKSSFSVLFSYTFLIV